MTRQEKVQLLKRSFERIGKVRAEGETIADFVERVITEEMQQYKRQFLMMHLQTQLSIETPPERIDISDI